MMKGKIEINREQCKGCTFCITACPKMIIRLSAGFNNSGYFPAVVDDMEQCTGCAMCAEMCPEIAIEVWREE
ncbi:MAG: 4Fe-4S dicluster domain-containing protein [Nitrospirae bacterium]|nr:4Fe-4S dicluster domain-containing protein [Nitrospirota bacterium]